MAMWFLCPICLLSTAFQVSLQLSSTLAKDEDYGGLNLRVAGKGGVLLAAREKAKMTAAPL